MTARDQDAYTSSATAWFPRYARNRTGEVVHRLDCKRRGRTSLEWPYVEGLPVSRVMEQIERIPWLSACGYCLPAASHASTSEPCCEYGPPGHTEQQHHDASACYDAGCRFDHPLGGPYPHPCGVVDNGDQGASS